MPLLWGCQGPSPSGCATGYAESLLATPFRLWKLVFVVYRYNTITVAISSIVTRLEKEFRKRCNESLDIISRTIA